MCHEMHARRCGWFVYDDGRVFRHSGIFSNCAILRVKDGAIRAVAVTDTTLRKIRMPLLSANKIANGTSLEQLHMREANGNPWLTTGLLTLCFTLSYTDRHVLSLLVDPVKASLHLSDTQIGIVQGLGFSIFYVLASLPLARLSDRGNRPRIMSACIAVWCLMTMFCGLVTQFWQLLLARIGVAASEAGVPPAALTMMADVNNPRHLAQATSIFMLSPYLGGGIALIGGGALYGSVQHWGPNLPWGVGSLQAWQLVFLLVGAPGLIAAALILLLREPRPQRTGAVESRNFVELFAFLRTQRRLSVYNYLLTMAMMVIMLSANVSWMPAVLMRAHHVDAHTVGLLFGPVFLVFGVVGTLSAGAIIGRSGEAMLLRTFRFMRWCIWIAVPAAAIGPLLPLLWIKLPLVALVPALVGTGLGPLLVGALSDRLIMVQQPLSLALSVVCATAGILAALMLNSLVKRASDELGADSVAVRDTET